MAEEKKPERRITFMCRIQADSVESLIGDLRYFQTEIARGQLTAGVSGGYSSGSIYALRTNPDATHESYFRELEAMLEAEKAQASATS